MSIILLGAATHFIVSGILSRGSHFPQENEYNRKSLETLGIEHQHFTIFKVRIPFSQRKEVRVEGEPIRHCFQRVRPKIHVITMLSCKSNMYPVSQTCSRWCSTCFHVLVGRKHAILHLSNRKGFIWPLTAECQLIKMRKILFNIHKYLCFDQTHLLFYP